MPAHWFHFHVNQVSSYTAMYRLHSKIKKGVFFLSFCFAIPKLVLISRWAVPKSLSIYTSYDCKLIGIYFQKNVYPNFLFFWINFFSKNQVYLSKTYWNRSILAVQLQWIFIFQITNWEKILSLQIS